MGDLAATVEVIADAPTWDARVALVRRVPEEFGLAHQQEVYAAIAERVYVPSLAPDFAYVHWRDEYELAPVEDAYAHATRLTDGFAATDVSALARTIETEPATLWVFRLLLGFTAQEFSAAAKIIADRDHLPTVGVARIKGMEAGSTCNGEIARCCAVVIDETMAQTLFPSPAGAVRSKIAKPDTVAGWESVRRYARDGVPLAVFLHQRHYGGAFRQLLDSTSTKRGDVIEDAVEALFRQHGIPFLRTGSQDQAEIERRFGLTVKPAPDFVLFDRAGTLRAVLECKGANDGGTARDKAARFRSLRAETARLGGVPLFAVLAGLGWKRTADALGPVVRETDGRVFTLPTLADMLTVQPCPTLIGLEPTAV